MFLTKYRSYMKPLMRCLRWHANYCIRKRILSRDGKATPFRPAWWHDWKRKHGRG